MSKWWKKWRPLILTLPVFWLGLYLWAWFARHGCSEQAVGACLVSAFGNWGADVVMFRWVDTTLGAGLLAVLAGAGAIFAVYFQRSLARQEALSERKVQFIETMIVLRQSFYDLMLLAASGKVDEVKHAIQAVAPDVALLARRAPWAAESVSALMFGVRRYTERLWIDRALTEQQADEMAVTMASMGARYCGNVQHFFDDKGEVRQRKAILPAWLIRDYKAQPWPDDMKGLVEGLFIIED